MNIFQMRKPRKNMGKSKPKIKIFYPKFNIHNRKSFVIRHN